MRNRSGHVPTHRSDATHSAVCALCWAAAAGMELCGGTELDGNVEPSGNVEPGMQTEAAWRWLCGLGPELLLGRGRWGAQGAADGAPSLQHCVHVALLFVPTVQQRDTKLGALCLLPAAYPIRAESAGGDFQFLR